MKPTIIGIAGGTASGKTTIAKQLYEEAKNIESVILIRIDDYYFGKIKVPMADNGIPNFDHPDAYDVDLIVQNLEDLINNKAIEKPTYDFVEHNRSRTTTTIKPTRIIIIEGILVLEDERVRDLATIKLFVESDDDIRFIRRLVRDTKERGRSIESVINQYLTTVKPMYYSFIKPTKRYADMIIPNDGTHDVAVDCIARMINDMLKGDK